MTVKSHAGAFNITTGTSNVSVTGVGFTPKVVLFWMVGRTESTDAVGGATAQHSFGWASSTTERRVVAGFSVDGSGTSNTSSGMREDAVLAEIDGGENWDGLADLASFDADGFTLAIDDAFDSDWRVHYLALGGSSLTDVAVGTGEIQESTGTESITGLGFQPDAMVFATARTDTSSSYPKTNNHFSMGVGFAAGSASGNQARWAGNAEDGVSTSDTHGFCAAGECLGQLWQNQTGHAFRAAMSSFDSDGFTLDWLETHSLDGADDYFWLALGGGSYHVGNALTQTDTTTDISESGFGFAPSGGLVLSRAQSEDSAPDGTAECEVSLGAFSATDERGVQAAKDEDAQDTTSVSTVVEHDAVYANLSAANAVEGLMDVKSMDSDGVTFIMDDADPSQSFFAYLAVGPASTETTVSETTGPADSVEVTLNATVDVQESVGPADVLDAAATLTGRVEETTGFTDTVEAAATLSAGVTEAVGPSDVDDNVVATLAASIAEGVSAEETWAETLMAAVAVEEAIGPSDTWEAPIGVEVQETVGALDTVVSTLQAAGVINEQVGPSEAQQAALQAVADLQEQVGPQDTWSLVAQVLSAALKEDTGPADTFAATLTAIGAVTESVGTVSTEQVTAQLKAALQETLGPKATEQATAQLVADVQEQAGPTDTWTVSTAAATVSASLQETLGVADTEQVVAQFKANLKESVGLSETATVSAQRTAQLLETVGVEDIWTASASLSAGLTETAGVSDTWTFPEVGAALTAAVKLAAKVAANIDITAKTSADLETQAKVDGDIDSTAKTSADLETQAKVDGDIEVN